jgi:Fur family zinc uptake transcriptional regulator
MPDRQPHQPFPPPGHNHGRCSADALERLKEVFAQRKMRLTDLRQHVFEEIAASHQAFGAYDILERMAAKGNRLAPISVYRAIEALMEAGVVHRLESRNAFFACHASHRAGHGQIVLTCERCTSVAEVGAGGVLDDIDAAARAVGFEVRRAIVEVSGLCGHCTSQ